MTSAATSKQFRQEVAKEKARISGRPNRTPPALETAALEAAAGEWTHRQETKSQHGAQPDTAAKPGGPEPETGMPLVRVAPGAQVASRTDPSADWAQYDPFRKPEDEAEKPKEVNAVTMFMAAKKLMAREWRRARGITKPDPRVVAFEEEARTWEERRRQAEQRERDRLAEGDRQKARIGEYLGRFVDTVLATPKPRRPKSLEDTAKLLKEAFEHFGEVFDVEWPDEGGCAIWLEPWAYRRARRAAGQTRPSLHRVVLGTKLDVISYELVTDEKLQQRKRQDLLVKPLRFSAKELEKLRGARNLPEIITQRMQGVGRVLEVRRANNGSGGWHIYVQPWDQVRICRLHNRPSTAVETYGIALDDDLQVRFIQLLPSKEKKNGSEEREENPRFL